MTDQSFQTNIEELLTDPSQEIFHERNLLLFNSINIIVNEYYKNNIMPILRKKAEQKSFKISEEGVRKESDELPGALIVYDKYNKLGHVYKIDLNRASEKEQVGILNENNRFNSKCYDKLYSILDDAEGASLFIKDIYLGNCTIDGALSSALKEFRDKNKIIMKSYEKFKDEDIRKYYEYKHKEYTRLSKEINKHSLKNISKLFKEEEKKQEMNCNLSLLKADLDDTLGTVKELKKTYMNDAFNDIDTKVSHSKTNAALGAALYANNDYCSVFHISQTPKPPAYLGNIIVFNKDGVGAKIIFNLDEDKQIRKEFGNEFVFEKSRGLCVVYEKYKLERKVILFKNDKSNLTKDQVTLDKRFLVKPDIINKFSKKIPYSRY
jgi:hypothetical protein